MLFAAQILKESMSGRAPYCIGETVGRKSGGPETTKRVRQQEWVRSWERLGKAVE